jgi:hypothetical protein
MTLRELYAKLDIELKASATNDVRFKLFGEFDYNKGEKLTSHISVENKILRPFNHHFNFGRVKDSQNVVAKYFLEALLNREYGEAKRYNLEFDITPNGRDISSNIVVEKLNVKILNGKLTLTSNQDSKVDYTVAFNGQSARGGSLTINGQVLVDLFNSNIDLAVDFKNPKVQFPKPAKVQLGHLYDGSDNAKSFIQMKLDLPFTPINHGLKMIFNYNVATNNLAYLEFEISRPSSSVPLSLFYEKTKTTSDDVKTLEYSFGLRNALLDLANSQSSIASTLVKVDDQTNVKSLIVNFVRNHSKGKQIDHLITVKKNDVTFVVVRDKIFGNIESIRSSTAELPKQAFGAELYVKVLENSGAISAKLNIESSQKNKKHNLEFEFKTENLFRILSRLSSINSKFNLNNENLKAEVEVKKLGEVKSFKLSSSGNLRSSGNSKEFDVNYEKRLANGKLLKSSGIAKYTFKNFKNFETSVKIDKSYESRIFVENKRYDESSGLFGYHNFEFTNSHLDFEPSERRIQFLINNKTESNGARQLDFVVNLKRGDLGKLDNRDNLNLLIDLSSKQSLSESKKLVKSLNNLSLKSKRFNLDLDVLANADLNPNGQNRLESKSNIKFPALITDPGKLAQLSHKLDYTRNKQNEITLNSQFETDSKLFGRIFRVLNVNYDRKLNSADQSINAKLDLSYKLAKNADESELTNWNILIDHDYNKQPRGTFLKLNVKQDRLAQFDSRLKPGTQIQVSDCSYSHLINREKASNKYSSQGQLTIGCNGKTFTHNLFSLSRTLNENAEASTRFELSTKSDLFYSEGSIRIAHDKFTKSSGLFAISTKLGERLPFSNEFSYTRKANSETNKLERGTYRMATSFGTALSKVCELNIESRDDYYNSLNCRMNTTRVPNVELNYGYNLKLDNLQQFIYGKRGYQFDLIVPGRTLRATYKANYPSYIDGNDDDEDENNEREFNATATFHWDLVKEPSKFLTVNLKRDNYAKGKAVTFVQLVNSPHFNLLELRVNKERTSVKTNINAALSYEMKSGAKNRLALDALFQSDLTTNSFSLETSLERPSFNTLYENRFNKNNGRLQYLGIRVGKLIKLVVDKESDPEQRRISLQLSNPDESKYSLNVESSVNNRNVHVVESTLSEASRQLAKLVSKFDSTNNNFDVTVNALATGNVYNFNFGLFNETLANVVAKKVCFLNYSNNQIIKY